MTSDAVARGADGAGKAWALNENIEATKPQAKIEAIFDIVLIPLTMVWMISKGFNNQDVGLAGATLACGTPYRNEYDIKGCRRLRLCENGSHLRIGRGSAAAARADFEPAEDR